MSVNSGSGDNDTNVNDKPAADQTSTALPGERLRQAREAQGLAREDVASELRLDLKFIKALEEDDLEHLPEPVFTAGYLRSYARLVGLPADELVQQYVNADTRDLPPVTTGTHRLPDRYSKVADALPNSFSVSSHHHASDSGIKKQVWLIVAMVLVVLISWQSARWMGKESDTQEMNDTSADAVLQGDATQATSTQQAAQSQPEGKATPAGGAAKQLPSVTTPSQQQAQTGEQIRQSLPLKPINETAQLAANEAGEAAQELIQLSLRFSENSWVDIRDSTGKRLIRELGIKGAQKQISGVAPFQVLLGYGPGVELEYNGKPYDFSDYQNQKVARFTLDLAEGTGLDISAPSSQPAGEKSAADSANNASEANQQNSPGDNEPEIGD